MNEWWEDSLVSEFYEDKMNAYDTMFWQLARKEG